MAREVFKRVKWKLIMNCAFLNIETRVEPAKLLLDINLVLENFT